MQGLDVVFKQRCGRILKGNMRRRLREPRLKKNSHRHRQAYQDALVEVKGSPSTSTSTLS
jgi:hypothetical protein